MRLQLTCTINYIDYWTTNGHKVITKTLRTIEGELQGFLRYEVGILIFILLENCTQLPVQYSASIHLTDSMSYWSWVSMRSLHQLLGCLLKFGLRQRTKWGEAANSLSISWSKLSRKWPLTVSSFRCPLPPFLCRIDFLRDIALITDRWLHINRSTCIIILCVKMCIHGIIVTGDIHSYRLWYISLPLMLIIGQ